jgi:hypothetical protein
MYLKMDIWANLVGSGGGRSSGTLLVGDASARLSWLAASASMSLTSDRTSVLSSPAVDAEPEASWSRFYEISFGRNLRKRVKF